jgi:hypothetical protein
LSGGLVGHVVGDVTLITTHVIKAESAPNICDVADSCAIGGTQALGASAGAFSTATTGDGTRFALVYRFDHSPSRRVAWIMMKRRRKGEPSFKPIVVTLDDGTVVRCSIASIGRESTPRWMLIDRDGIQYVGPEATADKSPEGVQRLVSEWWTTKKPAG